MRVLCTAIHDVGIYMYMITTNCTWKASWVHSKSLPSPHIQYFLFFCMEWTPHQLISVASGGIILQKVLRKEAEDQARFIGCRPLTP